MDNQDAPISATTKKRQRKSAADILAGLDAQQARIDDARAAARKSLERRATHVKIMLGGLLFAMVPHETEPWDLTRQLIGMAKKNGIKTDRVTQELDSWIRDQAEISAMRARGRRRT